MTHNQTPDDAPPDVAPPASAGTAGTQASDPATEAGGGSRPLPPAAARALAEAEERRRAAAARIETDQKPVEHGGRAGPDPVRYGDWEKGGIVSDF